MVDQEEPPEINHGPERSLNQKQRTDKQTTTRSSRKKTARHAADARLGCIMIAGEGSCPEWQDLLVQFPMIDSVQREDFPDHGASFTYLAHFYRTNTLAEEGSRAREEFKRFLQAIGYEYDSAGDFESRWFEGVGVKISSKAVSGPHRLKNRAV